MKIKADAKSVEIIDEEKITSGAYNDVTLEVVLSDEYDGLTTFITFNDIKTMVVGNMVNVPTLNSGLCRIGVYAVKIENDETTLRYSPTPATINILSGSFDYKRNEEAPIPTPSETERIYSLIDKAIEEGKLKGEKGEKGDKGDTGEQGPAGESGITIDELTKILPNKTSDLENDCNFASTDYIDSKISTKESTISINTDQNDLITLEHNTEYRYNNITGLAINLPVDTSESFNQGFISCIVIGGGATNARLTYPNNIIWSGDDTTDGKFEPYENKRYTIFIWWDGIWNATVRGIEI